MFNKRRSSAVLFLSILLSLCQITPALALSPPLLTRATGDKASSAISRANFISAAIGIYSAFIKRSVSLDVFRGELGLFDLSNMSILEGGRAISLPYRHPGGHVFEVVIFDIKEMPDGPRLAGFPEEIEYIETESYGIKIFASRAVVKDARTFSGILFDAGSAIEKRHGIKKDAPSAPRRTAGEAIALFKKAGRPLEITAHLRGVDGPGSSLDILEFQKRLTKQGVRHLSDIPCTATMASEFAVRVKIELADDAEAIEYVAKDYGLTPGKSYKVTGKVQLTPEGRTPQGQMDAPAYIFSNIFDLKGFRITCEEMPPMALAGGMEGSAAFNTILVAAASMLSGADLAWGDIFAKVFELENGTLVQGPNGGQGSLSSILGGCYRHVWLSGIKNDSAELINPLSAFSIPLLRKDDARFMEERMMLVQAGKEYANGKPAVSRTASLINEMWTSLLRDNDEIGVKLHSQKLGLASKYTEALAAKDMAGVIEAVNEYVDIRDKLCRRWMELALDKSAGGYAKRYGEKLKKDPLLSEYYSKYGDALKDISLYSDTAKDLIKEARLRGIALMPLGAGGPGANLIAIGPKPGVVKKFLEEQGLGELNEKGARKIIRGTGTLRGFMPFRMSFEPIKFEGTKELALTEPRFSEETEYDESTGAFKAASEDAEDADSPMPKATWKELTQGICPAMVAFDLNGTLCGQYEEVNDAICKAIEELLRKNIKVVIVTGSRWEGREHKGRAAMTLEKRFWGKISPERRRGMAIFSDSSKYWKFDKSGKPYCVKTFAMPDGLKDRFLEVNTAFLVESGFSDAAKVSEKAGGFSIALDASKAAGRGFDISRLESLLKGRRIDLPLVGGSAFYEVSTVAKDYMIELAREDFGISDSDELLVFADSIGRYGSDSSMMRVRGAKGIYAGSADVKLPRNVYRTPEPGPTGSEQVLEHLLESLRGGSRRGLSWMSRNYSLKRETKLIKFQNFSKISLARMIKESPYIEDSGCEHIIRHGPGIYEGKMSYFLGPGIITKSPSEKYKIIMNTKIASPKGQSEGSLLIYYSKAENAVTIMLEGPDTNKPVIPGSETTRHEEGWDMALIKVYTDDQGRISMLDHRISLMGLSRTTITMMLKDAGVPSNLPELYKALDRFLILPEIDDEVRRREAKKEMVVPLSILNKAGGNPAAVTAEDIASIEDFVCYKSRTLNELALAALKKLARAGVISEERAKKNEIIFENYHIEEDLLFIERIITHDPAAMTEALKNLFGVNVKKSDVRSAAIKWIGRGKNKNVYTIKAMLKNGKIYTFAISTIRNDPIGGGFSMKDIEASTEGWRRLTALGSSSVPRFGVQRWIFDYRPLVSDISFPGRKNDVSSTDVGKDRWVHNDIDIVFREFVRGRDLQQALLDRSLTEAGKLELKRAALQSCLDIWNDTKDASGTGLFVGDPKPANIVICAGFGECKAKDIDLDALKTFHGIEELKKVIAQYPEYDGIDIIYYRDKAVAEYGKRDTGREKDAMAVSDKIHRLCVESIPALETGKTLWHVIPAELIPRHADYNQRARFLEYVRQLARSNAREKIRVVSERQDIAEVFKDLSSDPNNIVDAALCDEASIDRMPDSAKMLLFGKPESGCALVQIEAIIAALRITHIKETSERNERLGRLCRYLTNEAPGPLPNTDDLKEFARRFKIMLPPVKAEDAASMKRINDNLIRLLESA